MKLKRRKISGREKDEASIELLEQLRERLYFDDVSGARRAAFNLSWMQEDGLDVLKEALFSQAARRTKSAAAYGLRKMHGRMKKMALEVFKQGLVHADSGTKDACRNALELLRERVEEKPKFKGQPREGKFEIRDIPRKSRQKREMHKKEREEHLSPGEDFRKGKKQ